MKRRQINEYKKKFSELKKLAKKISEGDNISFFCSIVYPEPESEEKRFHSETLGDTSDCLTCCLILMDDLRRGISAQETFTVVSNVAQNIKDTYGKQQYRFSGLLKELEKFLFL